MDDVLFWGLALFIVGAFCYIISVIDEMTRRKK